MKIEQEKDSRPSAYSIDYLDVESLKEEYRRYSNSQNEQDRQYLSEMFARQYDLFTKMVYPERVDLNHPLNLYGLILKHQDDPFVMEIVINTKTVVEKMKTTSQEDEGEIKSFIEIYFTRQVKEKFSDHSFLRELWIKVLEDYKSNLEEYNQKMQEEVVPAIRDDIRRNFSKVRAYTDVEITDTDVDKVLSRVRFMFPDPLIPNRPGCYEVGSQIIHLSPFRITNRSYSHEFLHALSDERWGKEKTDKDDAFLWVGLNINTGSDSRFTWLNEATTETLAGIMVDVAPKAYPQERKLLHLLLTKGKQKIIPRILINAYFEKTNPDSDDRNKNWKVLIETIRSSYDHDKQFLFKLDRLVKYKGIDEAINFLESWDPAKPTEINLKEMEENYFKALEDSLKESER